MGNQSLKFAVPPYYGGTEDIDVDGFESWVLNGGGNGRIKVFVEEDRGEDSRRECRGLDFESGYKRKELITASGPKYYRVVWTQSEDRYGRFTTRVNGTEV